MSDQTDGTTNTLVKVLSGASIGLGVSELVAPGKVAAIAGVDDTSRSRRVIRALGVRECGHGAALLGGPAKLVWTRVAGDVLDMALLIAGVVARGPGRRRQGAISAALLSGIAGLDLYTALRTTGSGAASGAPALRAL
ncbi:malate dehydrogenase [Mycobacterium colombiense]|uniref:Malate dehydrogenase n=1 Tax=Mycobacterium colombiense TaxID=339268 RepID=A0A329KHS6_9MYCO|nr:malate dehydrogenase [Mycobacterium colombiense]RAU93411.1 malate dehydrogenase [Mycobacterium colombiense]